MHGEDKKDRSFTQHTPRFRFSQILVVTFLIVSIVIAVIIALPESWRRASERSSENETNSLINAVSDSTKESLQVIELLREVISDSQDIDGGTVEQIEVTTNLTTSTQTVHTLKTYSNYDWKVSFRLPAGWEYDRGASAFISEEETLHVAKVEEFILPAGWQLVEEQLEGIQSYSDTTSDTDSAYHLVERAIDTFIFTTASTTVTAAQHSIITSLQKL